MTTPVKYKKPRRINAVSITLVLLLAVGVYAAIQYLPLYMLRQEAYRVLEETGSTLAGRPTMYIDDREAVDSLRAEMQTKIRNVGVDDPKTETWIEFEGKTVRLGVLYSSWVEWPFGVIPRQESIYEIEHELVLP